MEFLRENKKLEMPKLKAEAVEGVRTKKGSLDFNPDLFNSLRILRKELADKANVPPFVIFGDTSLQEMAYYFPKDKDQFARISGVGAKKLEQFGETFLHAINTFAKARGISPVAIPEKGQEEPMVQMKRQSPVFYTKTRELLLKKIPIDRIAKNQDLQQSTIVNHIEKLIDGGERLDLLYLKLPQDRYEAMKKAFEECGDEKLKPVFEYLGEKYSYDELRLVRVLMRV